MRDDSVDAYANPWFVVTVGRVLRHNDQEPKRPNLGAIGLQPRSGSSRLSGRGAGIDHSAIDRSSARSITSLGFLDSYLVAIEDGRWRILGGVVHVS
jgi:hypothetical protein